MRLAALCSRDGAVPSEATWVLSRGGSLGLVSSLDASFRALTWPIIIKITIINLSGLRKLTLIVQRSSRCHSEVDTLRLTTGVCADRGSHFSGRVVFWVRDNNLRELVIISRVTGFYVVIGFIFASVNLPYNTKAIRLSYLEKAYLCCREELGMSSRGSHLEAHYWGCCRQG